MGNRDDHDLVCGHDIDERVSKPAKTKLANQPREHLTDEWTFSDESGGFQQILLEPLAETRPLRIEVSDRFVDLGLGRLEEASVHLPATGSKSREDFLGRNGFDPSGAVLGIASLALFRPELVVLFFRQIFQAVEKLTCQFRPSR